LTLASCSSSRLLVSVFLGVVWVGCASPLQPADLVLTGGTIHTVAEAMPRATTVAIRDGEIVYVGDADGVERFVGPETETVDLGGRLVLPGFIDTHAHPVQAAGLAMHCGCRRR
jgi:predicted amidohydrolase YtcJ